MLKSCCGNTQTDGRTDTTDRLVRSVTVVHDLVVFLSGVSGESTDHRSLLVDVADDAIDDVVQAVGHSELQRRLIDQLRSLQTSTSHTLDSLRSTVLPPGESPVFVDVANNAVDDVVDAVRDTELQRRNIDQLLSLHTALRCTSQSLGSSVLPSGESLSSSESATPPPSKTVNTPLTQALTRHDMTG